MKIVFYPEKRPSGTATAAEFFAALPDWREDAASPAPKRGDAQRHRAGAPIFFTPKPAGDDGNDQ